MKILFHPSFDDGYYLNLSKTEQNSLGTKVVGLSGLLEHLSLHNGISGRFASDGERAASYLSHVRQCAEGTIIEASFQNDSLGVTRCLLAWRDLLIMAGWTPRMCGDEQTPKLKLLSSIEASWNQQMRGSADRWRELAELAEQQSLIATNDVIECRCSREELPYLVQKVLESYNAQFTEYPDSMYLNDDLDIHVVHYNDLTDAYRQVASHLKDYQGSVIINRDNVSLNHILFSWGRPLQNAVIQESNPLTLQLFKLAMSVFSRPLNIQNILSYLQLPKGPVPRKLCSALANVLVTDGGFGEVDWNDLDEQKAKDMRKAGVDTKWRQVIYDFIHDENEDDKSNPITRSSMTTLLRHITDDSAFKDGMIDTRAIREYIGAINKWASPKANDQNEKDEALKSQLSTVVSYFKQLSNALEGLDAITYEDLEKMVRTIYQPTYIVQARAQVGSLNVVRSYQQLVDAPENLVWLDCCGADEITDPYEFLSASERNWLNAQKDVCVPVLQDLLALNRKEMIAQLSRVHGPITLITSDYHHNQKMAEHPLVAELKMQRGDRLKVQEGVVDLPLSDSKETILITQKGQYKLGKLSYESRRESNTSIDTLINYSFDYTAHYVARLGEPSHKELESIQRVTGLVAHLFIQNLVNDTSDQAESNRLDAMNRLLESEFKPRLEAAVQSTGLVLLLKENEVEYKNLPFLLKRSVWTLIRIMTLKHLIPVGCELKYDESLGGVINDFYARIDMELKDALGNAVILDFKWTYSDYYGDKIKEGTAIQLELYRRELEQQGKKVSAVGYYLMPKCQLVTSDYDTLKDGPDNQVIIQHIEPPQDANLFKQIQNSIAQRRFEISEGDIEEGEEMDIKELPYSQELLNGTNMLVVGTIKRKKPTQKNPNPPVEAINKKSNMVFVNKPKSRFTKEKTNHENEKASPNEKPTTYPLMKGRLK